MKILVAEDSKYYRKILVDTLRAWKYDVVIASDGIEALEIIKQEDGPRLAIINWIMPGLDGLELCRKVRAWEKEGYVYLILLTANAGKENIVKGLEAGADDYIIKPFDEEVLKCRLKIGERIINLENEIRRLANLDHLTGVLNRRAFMERLDSEIARCQRIKIPLALIMSDLDNFKSINDNYGHQTGDEVLRMVAGKTKNLVRKYDFIGRYGGEEFVICTPGASLLTAKEIAERLRREIEESVIPVEKGACYIKVTASFGISFLEGDSSTDIDSLIKRADDALYLAKKQGKNQIVIK
ncbi:MAG: GGDEF domain-containing protein [Bacillota bacterium]